MLQKRKMSAGAAAGPSKRSMFNLDNLLTTTLDNTINQFKTGALEKIQGKPGIDEEEVDAALAAATTMITCTVSKNMKKIEAAALKVLNDATVKVLPKAVSIFDKVVLPSEEENE